MNAKKKGNHGENVFAEFLREHGFKAYRDSASGASTHKSDIVNGLDYSMEVKTVKAIRLKEAWKQVTRDASIAHNSPLLAIHFDGMPDKTWIVCMSSEDWIENEKMARQTPQNPVANSYKDPGQDRELAFALSQLKLSLSKVQKYLND
jgi:Holliday junction resolvase